VNFFTKMEHDDGACSLGHQSEQGAAPVRAPEGVIRRQNYAAGGRRRTCVRPTAAATGARWVRVDRRETRGTQLLYPS